MGYERCLLKSLVSDLAHSAVSDDSIAQQTQENPKNKKKATAIRKRHRYSEPMQQTMETCKTVQELWKKKIRQKSTLLTQTYSFAHK
jgi:hypothetical protein